MPASAPPLVPLFRSDSQMRLLAAIFFEEPMPGSQLARELDLPQQTVARELARLEAAGVITATQVGSAKVYRPVEALPFFQPLRQMLAYAGGVIPALRDAYEPIEEIVEVFIFGSWARRYHGEPGPPPNDIDVAVVSDTLTNFDLAESKLAVEQTTNLRLDQFVLTTDNPRLGELRQGSVEVLRRSDR